MRALLTSLGAVILATPALADPQTGLLQWQVSADGTTWASSIVINPGDAYPIRAAASCTAVPGTQNIGIAGVSFDQIDLIGADASDVFGGASGPSGVPAYLTRIQPAPAESWLLETG